MITYNFFMCDGKIRLRHKTTLNQRHFDNKHIYILGDVNDNKEYLGQWDFTQRMSKCQAITVYHTVIIRRCFWGTKFLT